jgi:hypothetical protein
MNVETLEHKMSQFGVTIPKARTFEILPLVCKSSENLQI